MPGEPCDDGDLLALRHGNWKMHFKVQDAPGTMEVWQREFRGLRLPYLFNLRMDPYERATITSNTYWDWYIRHVFLLVPAQDKVAEFLATFKEYPPRQKAASFTIDQVLQKMQEGHGG
jgi:arylsulfatase